MQFPRKMLGAAQPSNTTGLAGVCSTPGAAWLLVLMVGIEPTRPCGQQGLSLPRMPIPAHQHMQRD